MDRSGARAAAARHRQRPDVPRHQPGLPGRDDLGHVPPRGRRGPGAADRQRLLALDALIARVGVWRGWTRPVAWLGADADHRVGGSCSVSRSADISARRPRRPARYEAWRADGRGRASARRDGRADHHRLPDLAGRGAARSRRWPCPTSRPPRRDLARAFPGTHYLVMSDDEHGRGRPILAEGAPGRRLLPRARPRRPVRPRRRPRRAGDARVRDRLSVMAGPLYSERHGRHAGRRCSGWPLR